MLIAPVKKWISKGTSKFTNCFQTFFSITMINETRLWPITHLLLLTMSFYESTESKGVLVSVTLYNVSIEQFLKGSAHL